METRRRICTVLSESCPELDTSLSGRVLAMHIRKVGDHLGDLFKGLFLLSIFFSFSSYFFFSSSPFLLVSHSAQIINSGLSSAWARKRSSSSTSSSQRGRSMLTSSL